MTAPASCCGTRRESMQASSVIAQPLVSLRPEGLYCPAGNFFIDPWRPVERAVITHAHGDHARAGSKAYYAAAVGESILAIRIGRDAPIHGLAYGQQVEIGDARVSLHPAGHILGSSQVRIEVDGRVWVISGDYKRNEDPTCTPFEVVPCDVFITEATFAIPIYRWNSGADTAQEVRDWWRLCAAKGANPLLFCYALGKAQRILAELARLGDLPPGKVLLHGSMLPLTDAYRDAGVVMPETEYLGEDVPKESLPGRLVLAPPSAYRSSWMRRFKSFETGFASGWVRVRGALRQRGHDRGFVLSDHADWPDLVRTVRETGAKHTFVTHGRSDLLVRWLNEHGHDASPLKTEFGGDEGEA